MRSPGAKYLMLVGSVMSMPVHSLPVVQNWSCHTCGDCCRELEAVITDEEKQRIERLDLATDPEVGPSPWFGRKGDMWTLKHRPEGGCVFLTSANRCRLHEKFGAEVKPFACNFFPFLLLPAGNHWRLGVRFSCPSIVENKGRRLTEYDGELAHLSHELEKHVGREGSSAPPPLLQPGQKSTWPDVLRFVQALVDIMQDRSSRVERRLRKCLALAHVCRQARFDTITGNRLEEFLVVVRSGLEIEVAKDARDVPPPSRMGRMLFRTLLAIFARKDWGRNQGTVARSRMARMRAGWRFIRGTGQVPPVHRLLPDATFEEIDKRPGLPPALDDLLERYYRIKLHSLQFCGPPNFAQSLWGGLESLILTYPMIQWLARAFADQGPMPALQKALLLVDDHFGGNPLLGFRHNRFFIRTLAQWGDLERLVAHYAV